MNGYRELETESFSLNCPNCGEALERNAFEGGRRLTRCWHCGEMVRSAVRSSRGRAETSPFSSSEWAERNTPKASGSRIQLEQVPSHPYPNLQCPYCEHLNRELVVQADKTSFYCTNCGAELKKACLNCERPMYVLDHFCPYCRTDQEEAQYELEALYWQQFNEGKRLAKIGHWEDAHRHLALFFNPDAIGADPVNLQRAEAVYRHSIATVDEGEGLRLFNESLQRLRHQIHEELKQEERRRWAKWGLGLLVLGLLALWSAVNFGAWWAIFAIALGVIVVIGLLILFVLLSISGM
ncbi:MAG: zinc ribbon domain-containing protein [Chloroflexota bacterium]|nr:zinc ribbon domain-containing protein [Chloroflexota bacterium]